MAKSKMRKYGLGGDVDTKDVADSEVSDMQDEAEASPTPAPTPKAAPKIVTKEELAKSGLSLRDYLNKQQGLTRRGEASAPAPAAKPAATSTASRPGIMARMREADKSVKGVREAASEAKAPAESRLVRGSFSASKVNPKTLMPYKESSAASRYAAGGSVGSASRRADGIAAKGKTRGRMC